MINSLHLIKKTLTYNSLNASINSTRLFNNNTIISNNNNITGCGISSIYSYFSQNFFTKREPRKNLNKTKKNNPNDRNKGSKAQSNQSLKKHTLKKQGNIEKDEEDRREEELNGPKKKKKSDFKNSVNKSTKKVGPVKFNLSKQSSSPSERFKNFDYNLNNEYDLNGNKITDQPSKFENTSFTSNFIKKPKQPTVNRKMNEVIIKEHQGKPEIIKLAQDSNQENEIDNTSDAGIQSIIESKDQPTYTEHNRVKFRVSKEMEGMRVDRWIGTKLPVLPHSLICRWLRNKVIFMENGELSSSSTDEQPIMKRHKLKHNDKVIVGTWVYFPSQAILDQQIADVKDPKKYIRFSDQEIKEIRESVIYKDEHILVINKPQGLSVQGGSGLLKHLDMMLGHLRFEKDENPKLVHRLDKATSGILILGRSRLAATAMTEKFELKLVPEKEKNKDRDIQSKDGNGKKRNNKEEEDEGKEYNKGIRKTYWALLSSTPTPKEGRIRAPLKKVLIGGEEKVVPCVSTGDGAKLAITEYKVVESSLTKQCFVILWPETGRTHQLRVHCASVLNTPIIGDTKYGDKETNDSLKSVLGDGLKLHLHARRIEFTHPFTNKKMDIVAPLSKELSKNWKKMGFDFKFDDKSI